MDKVYCGKCHWCHTDDWNTSCRAYRVYEDTPLGVRYTNGDCGERNKHNNCERYQPIPWYKHPGVVAPFWIACIVLVVWAGTS